MVLCGRQQIRPNLGLHHDDELWIPVAYERTRDQWCVKGKPGVFNSVAKQLLRLCRTGGRCVSHQNSLVGPLGQQTLYERCDGE